MGQNNTHNLKDALLYYIYLIFDCKAVPVNVPDIIISLFKKCFIFMIKIASEGQKNKILYKEQNINFQNMY